MGRLSLSTLSLLIFTPVLIAGGQILFKQAGARLQSSGAPFASLAADPRFVGAVAIYGAATLLWVQVLRSVPLTYAYSFMALTYVMVPLMAVFWLGETLTLRYALGAALVAIGLIVIQS